MMFLVGGVSSRALSLHAADTPCDRAIRGMAWAGCRGRALKTQQAMGRIALGQKIKRRDFAEIGHGSKKKGLRRRTPHHTNRP